MYEKCLDLAYKVAEDAELPDAIQAVSDALGCDLFTDRILLLSVSASRSVSSSSSESTKVSWLASLWPRKQVRCLKY